ncbi:glycerophosphodiester phosphodiesterase [Chloroflexota bacterium]
MLHNWPNPLVIAHRGASLIAPENTLSAFKLAEELKADAIELDVKLTSDRQVVVIHDYTVDRTTNGTGKVSDKSLAEIKELDAGGTFNDKYSGEKIPTLREVFELLGDQIRLNIELTNYSSPLDRLVHEVHKIINEFNFQDTILISSFLPSNLKLVRKLMPGIPCGLLTFPGLLGWLSRKLTRQSYYEALHIHVKDIDEKEIKKVHLSGKNIYTWTINSKKGMKEALNMGVDGIFTDDPALLRSIVGNGK